jgi:hypothetical protein
VMIRTEVDLVGAEGAIAGRVERGAEIAV